jgi:hypothetical protein
MTSGERYEAPGGAIDPAFADGIDVFVATPRAASGAPAWRQAQKYIELVQARDFAGLPDLFTDDAIIFPPLRRRPLVGRAEIVDFYTNTVAKVTPHVIAVSIFGEGRECFMELATQFEVDGRPRYLLTTIDHFTIADDGRFSRMVVYVRPASPGSQMANNLSRNVNEPGAKIA